MKDWELEDKTVPWIFGPQRVNPTQFPVLSVTRYIPSHEFQMAGETVPHPGIYENTLHSFEPGMMGVVTRQGPRTEAGLEMGEGEEYVETGAGIGSRVEIGSQARTEVGNGVELEIHPLWWNWTFY